MPSVIDRHPSPSVMPVHLVILSEVRLYREGLALTVSSRESEIEVVGACEDPESVAEIVRFYPAAVVLVDVALPKLDEAVRWLSSRRPAPRLLALSLTPGSDQAIVDAAESGFSGLVPANASVEDLIQAVEGAARGELECSPKAAAGLARRVASLAASQSHSKAAANLTARELEIAELLESGFSNKQIARHLSIQLATVKNHVHNLLSKLNVERRGEAVAALRGEAAPSTKGFSKPERKEVRT